LAKQRRAFDLEGEASMDRSKEIARAYYIEGEVDFQIARILYQNGFNSRTIFFSQQAAEKIIKACLALKGIFVTDHSLSSVFTNVYHGEIEDMDQIIKAATELERHGTKARFPLHHRPNLPIWIPSREYKTDDAMNSLTNLEVIFRRLKLFLETKIPL
jgi:HEPN domain-containing protein